MIPNNTQKVSLILIIIKYNFRAQQIQDTKQYYANILALLKAAVMEINVNLPMEIRNYVLIILRDFLKWEWETREIKCKIVC